MIFAPTYNPTDIHLVTLTERADLRVHTHTHHHHREYTKLHLIIDFDSNSTWNLSMRALRRKYHCVMHLHCIFEMIDNVNAEIEIDNYLDDFSKKIT